MKAVLAAVALTVGTAQTVAWTDCCCGSFCEQKNACTGCRSRDGGLDVRVAPAANPCCGPSGTPAGDVCSHLEPSTEIDVPPAPDDLKPATDVAPPRPVLAVRLGPASAGKRAVPSRSPPPGRGPVLLSILQI
ncbi:MAG TPA: hypothetical protein VEJ18_18225 [Planctomycetota bacterium]|nr:hypothetical protein [Planctomycetota bacterium]